ncbi:MAG: SMI1/KNR4 family protein [Planctomycetes bacterium]|nr:SMI1/KNR4 family protein [Planctomycetota bacterium]
MGTDSGAASDPALAALFRRLAAAGWKPGPPVAREQVEAIEQSFRVPFPPDYMQYLIAAGRSTGGVAWRGLWHADELLGLNRTLPPFRWFGGLLGIGNEGFIVYALDYRAGLPPAIVSVGLSASTPDEINPEASGFSDWLDQCLPPARR